MPIRIRIQDNWPGRHNSSKRQQLWRIVRDQYRRVIRTGTG